MNSMSLDLRAGATVQVRRSGDTVSIQYTDPEDPDTNFKWEMPIVDARGIALALTKAAS